MPTKINTWSPMELPAGCWLSQSPCDRPVSCANYDEFNFAIYATLDCGAQKYFSGIRVTIRSQVIEGQHNFRIKDRKKSVFTQQNVYTKIIAKQLKGKKLAKRWRKRNTGMFTSLPLCNLVFEIVAPRTGSRYGNFDLVLLPPGSTELPQCILYDNISFCTPSSTSIILFLVTERSTNFTRAAQEGSDITNAYCTRILPPSTIRKPFVRLPPEILHMIFDHFREERKRQGRNWHGELASFSLVCRDWSVALEHLFHEISVSAHGNGFNPIPISRQILAHPRLGKSVRIFREPRINWPCQKVDLLEHSKAVLSILRNAPLINYLSLDTIQASLASDYVEALSNLRRVTYLLVPGPCCWGDQYYLPHIRDILKCMAHWPCLQEAKLSRIDVFRKYDANKCLDSAICKLEKLTMELSHISDSELIHMTLSSQNALKEVYLDRVHGLTNSGLRDWLAGVGPSLRVFKLIDVTVRGPYTDREEHAIDAMLPIMTNLHVLDLDGDVASELVVLRKPPAAKMPIESPSAQRSTLAISGLNGFSTERFIEYLNVTQWESIKLWDFFTREKPEELKKAEEICRDRNITLDIKSSYYD